MGNVAEPDTRHFPTFDVYTHVTYTAPESLKEQQEVTKDEYEPAKKYTMKKGDTIFSSNAIIILDSLSTRFDKAAYKLQKDDIAVIANLRLLDVRKTYQAKPIYIIRNNSIEPQLAKVDDLGLQFMFWKVIPESGKVEISLQEKKVNKRDFIVMQALVFPYINILWGGCIIMIIGTILAVVERVKRKI
jgi:cytochrome c-type biogenesis protein CcmF